MVKYTRTIRWQQSTNCLSVFDSFVGLALKGLIGLPRVTLSLLFSVIWTNLNRSSVRGNFLKFSFKEFIGKPFVKLLPGPDYDHILRN